MFPFPLYSHFRSLWLPAACPAPCCQRLPSPSGRHRYHCCRHCTPLLLSLQLFSSPSLLSPLLLPLPLPTQTTFLLLPTLVFYCLCVTAFVFFTAAAATTAAVIAILSAAVNVAIIAIAIVVAVVVASAANVSSAADFS